jgi:apolipoprotein N-acyltransferase
VLEHHTLCALPPAARALAAALMLLARLCLLLLLVALWRADDPPISVDMLARDFLALVLAPELCAHMLRRAFAGRARIEAGSLVVERGGRRLEVPCASIAGVAAWRLPLPLPGFALALRSGTRFPARLGLPDPAPLLESLGAAGVAAARGALRLPAMRYAAARAGWPRRWYDTLWCKVALVACLPGGIGFYAHQHIAFGGLLGEYYLMGPAAWLRSAALYWLTGALYLALWAGLFRIATEALCLAAAHAAPERAGGARRTAERAATLLFYASVPALLAGRFLS